MGVCKYGIGQLNVGLDSLLHHPTHLNGTHVVLFRVMLRQQDHDLKHYGYPMNFELKSTLHF